jgi:hypothetical protein
VDLIHDVIDIASGERVEEFTISFVAWATGHVAGTIVLYRAKRRKESACGSEVFAPSVGFPTAHVT